MTTPPARLQVLIATFGSRIEKIPPLPVVPGVAYLIGWQQPAGEIPAILADRRDICVLHSPGEGSSRNRNFLLDNASAELLLCADDDLIYTPESLSGAIHAFDSHPECHIITFRHLGETKPYPSESYDLLTPPKGASSSAIDIALRRESQAGRLRFDERFGIKGTLFSAAEDDLFMLRARQLKIPGRYVPHEICTHPGLSTGQRKPDRGALEAWGAYIALAHPLWQWAPRLLLKARRLSKAGQSPFWLSLSRLASGIAKLYCCSKKH